MRRRQVDFDRLISELEWDVEQLEGLVATNLRAQARIQAGSTDELDYAALGYTVHNLYGVMENGCFRVAKFFENGLSATSWHKELLERMLISIPDLRPEFLRRDEFLVIDELRAFRHAFRNLYSRPLDSGRLMLLQEKVPAACGAFRGAVGRFVEALTALRGRVGE